MIRSRLLLIVVATAVSLAWLLTQNAYAAGTTVTVNGTGDQSDVIPGDGACDVILAIAGDQCSLRAAIEELNALGPDSSPHQIEFNISGTGPFNIALNSELPNIEVPVVIDGLSQTGASCPTANSPANLQIVLDGGDQANDGLVFIAQSGGSRVRGLVIGNFHLYGIYLGSDENVIQCNHIGIGADSASIMANGYGIQVAGSQNIIGGQLSPAQRNVISGNDDFNIELTGDENLIQGNYIGTTTDGMSKVPGPGFGMYVQGDHNIIGGPNPLAGNVMSAGLFSDIISISNGQNNVIQGNLLGVAKNGVTLLPSAQNGIVLSGTAVGNVIGGTSPGDANTIANNIQNGITLITTANGIPFGNSIRGNAIFENGGLGIDLGDDDVDNNDPGDQDKGENEHQNYPVLKSSPGSSTVDVVLESQPNTTYQIDTYLNDSCDSSDFGEGQEYYLTFSKQTDVQGNLELTFSLGGVAGRYITAAVTDPVGNTSEFSACVLVEDVPTPTATATPTATVTQLPTVTSTNTPTATGTATSSPSPTPTNTTLPTSTPTPTGSATATATATGTGQPPTASPTSVVTVTGTPDPGQDETFFIYLPMITR